MALELIIDLTALLKYLDMTAVLELSQLMVINCTIINTQILAMLLEVIMVT